VEPRNIEAILSIQFEGSEVFLGRWKGLTVVADFSLGLRPEHLAPLMGSGIFTQDGAA